MISHRKYLSVCVLAIAAVAAVLFNPSLGTAATAPSLGAASSFAVLGGSAVTCTGSTITGDVGATGVVTTTNCVIVGTVHPINLSDTAVSDAQLALASAYSNAVNQPCTQELDATLGTDPGPLPPGVYCFNATGVAFTTKTLTLDGSTNPNGIWIFQVDAALTGTGFQVVMTNGAQPCNVYWTVGADVTMTDSVFQGNILAGNPAAAGGSITITGGGVVGRVLANTAVTLTTTSVGTCTLVDQAKGSGKKNCHKDGKKKHHNKKPKCNQGVGNGPEGCDPGKSDDHNGSNDEDDDDKPGNPGRKGGGK